MVEVDGPDERPYQSRSPGRRGNAVERATAVVHYPTVVTRRRVLGLLGLVIVSLLAVTIVSLPHVLRRVVVWRLQTTMGRPVTLARLDVSLLTGRLGLHQLRIVDRDQQPLATLERLEARLSLRALLRGQLRVTRATIEKPFLRIVRTAPGEFNVSDLRPRETRESTGGLGIEIERVAVVGGAVQIEDRTLSPARTWHVESVTLDARDLSTLAAASPGVVTLQAVAAGSPLSVWVTGVRLRPLAFHATVSAREIDLSLPMLYLAAARPATPTRGTLDLSGTVEHDGASGTRVSLDARLADVAVSRPGQAILSAPAVRVTVEDLRLRPAAVDLTRLTIDGGAMAIEDARPGGHRWPIDGVGVEIHGVSSAREASGVGTARAVVAGAPVSLWITRLRLAPFEVHTTTIVRNVDLALLRLWVPPDFPIEAERGVVNASIEVDHDGRAGTRLAVDVTGSDLDVRRGRHFVTAPAVRLTATDIAFSGGAVTVGRAGLTGERLAIEDRHATPIRRWPVRNLAVEASRLTSGRHDVQGIATARATVSGAEVSAWITGVRLDPLKASVTVSVRDLDLALVRLYLPEAMAVEPTAGIVNASVHAEHTAADGTSVDADLTLTNAIGRAVTRAGILTVSAPSLRMTLTGGRRADNALGLGRLELTGRGAISTGAAEPSRGPTRIELDRLTFATENVTWPARGPARVEVHARSLDQSQLDASGTATLTAPPPNLAWTADVALEMRSFNLATLGAYVPMASGVSGRLGATATATATYAGSLTVRARGGAEASGLALADGRGVPLSVARIAASGVEAQWLSRVDAAPPRDGSAERAAPLRLEVGKLAIVEPRAVVERDRQGRFPLAARFTRAPVSLPAAPATAEPAPGASAFTPQISVGEITVERGSGLFLDESTTERTRLEVPRLDATLRGLTWPTREPARLRVDATLQRNGAVSLEGTVSAAPARLDAQLVMKDVALALVQPYVPSPARVGGRVDAKLALTGGRSGAHVTARGEASVRRVSIADGGRPVITVESLDAAGIDAEWPVRVAIADVKVRRTWALIERDARGDFLLRRLLGRPSSTTSTDASPSPSAVAARPALELHLGRAVFEEGAATIVDGTTAPPARFDIAGARLTVEDFSWPSGPPVKLQLTSPTPQGGTVRIGATLELEPRRLDANVSLDEVQLAPAQPYLAIPGRVAGRVTGELVMKVALAPFSAQLTGQARVRAFKLSDGDLPVATVGRVEATGIDVDWPRRVAFERVRFVRPSLLIERDGSGEFRLPKLVTPRRGRAGDEARRPEISSSPGAAAAAAPPTTTTLEIATLNLDRASARFVDHTTTPAYAEEMSDVQFEVGGVTTAPGGRARIRAAGKLPGGASFTASGSVTPGEPRHLDLKVDLRDFVLPRANAYLNRFTGWTATRGGVTATASYTLDGNRLDARQDVVVRDVAVAQSGDEDEVQRRLGLPLSFLITLMKDSRGQIRLSVPVSGDLGSREFDFSETVWAAVRNLTIRLLALPMSRLGSLFVSPDSKVEAVTIDPLIFESGSSRLADGMVAHLDRVASFVRDRPAIRLGLEPIVTLADVDALKNAAILARLGATSAPRDNADALAALRAEYRRRWPERAPPPTLDAIVAALAQEEATPADAVQKLTADRVGVVRGELAKRGVEATRLVTRTRRTALVETAGVGRVEVDLTP